MALRRRLLATVTAATGLVIGLPAVPALAAPAGPTGRVGVVVQNVDETSTIDCPEQGLVLQAHDVFRTREFFSLRGKDKLPHFHGTSHGTTTVTDPQTGATVTITSNTVDKDLHVVDNGDGTFTVTILGAGGFKVVGPALTLRDPGRIVFQITVDNNGTPSDPSDDVEVEDSFQIIRESTGLNELGESFCADWARLTGLG